MFTKVIIAPKTQGMPGADASPATYISIELKQVYGVPSFQSCNELYEFTGWDDVKFNFKQLTFSSLVPSSSTISQNLKE